MEPEREITWRDVFREAFARIVSTPGLASLRDALDRDDPRLRQKVTVLPMPRDGAAADPTACCVVAWVAWQGDGLDTVADVEDAFGRYCLDMNLLMGEPGACSRLLNYWDHTPRDEARRELAGECRRELARRGVAA